MNRRKVIKNWIIFGVVAVLLSAGVWFGTYKVYDNKLEVQRADHQIEVRGLEDVIAQYEQGGKTAFVLREDVESGSVLEEKHLDRILVPSMVATEDLLMETEEVLGKVLKIDGKKGLTLTKPMVYDEGPIEDGMRWLEMEFVKLPFTVKTRDVVDIRIVFPTGEDYIVMSKKRLDYADYDSQVSITTVSGEELHMMQSAIVDAYMREGELYAIQYVDPEFQENPGISYIPNSEVVLAMETDPTVVRSAINSAKETLRGLVEQRNAGNAGFRIGSDYPSDSSVMSRKVSGGAAIIQAPVKGNSESREEERVEEQVVEEENTEEFDESQFTGVNPLEE